MSNTIQKQNETEINTNKPTKHYDEVATNVRKLLAASGQTFVPQLCDALRQDWAPELSDEKIKLFPKFQNIIREKIYDEWSKERGYSEDNVWKQSSINVWFPPWLRNTNRQEGSMDVLKEARNRKKILLDEREKQRLTQMATNLPKTVIIPQTKPEPISDEKLHDLGLGSYGDSHKTVNRIRNEIHEGIRLLFKALCDDKDLPNDGEDLLVDYIKPTREYRLGLAMEFDEAQRTNMHNKLHQVSEAIEDMIEQLDKADKK